MKSNVVRERFVEMLTSDLEYLKSIGAMNYCLEIGIYGGEQAGEAGRKRGGGRCFEHVDDDHLYVMCLSNIFVRWDGTRAIGGALSSLVSGRNKEVRTNINPKDYAKRLFKYMVGSVVHGER